MDLVNELDNVREAKKTFKTENVRKALRRFIDLIIQVAQRISQHFTRSKSC